MGIILRKTFGGKPRQVAAPGVACGRYPPPEVASITLRRRLAPYLWCGGPALRELSGGNWMACGPLRSSAPGTCGAGRSRRPSQ